MRLHAHLSIRAGDETARFTDRSDLATTILTVEAGDPRMALNLTQVHVTGTPAERAAFLGQLADAARGAAADLGVGIGGAA